MFSMLEGWVAWYHNDAGQLLPHPLNEGVPTWSQEYKSGHASGPAPAAPEPGKGSEPVSPTGAGPQDGSMPPGSLPVHSEDKSIPPASGPVDGASTSAEASPSEPAITPCQELSMLEGFVARYHNDAGQLLPHPLEEGVPTWSQEFKSGHASGPAPAATGPGKGSEAQASVPSGSSPGVGSQDGSTPPVSLPDHSDDKSTLPASGPLGGTSTSAEASSSGDLVLRPLRRSGRPRASRVPSLFLQGKPDFRPSAGGRHQ